jgi:hypothetical protein
MIGYILGLVGDFLGLAQGVEVVELEDTVVAVYHLAEEVVGDIAAAAAAEIGRSLATGVVVVPGLIVGDC